MTGWQHNMAVEARAELILTDEPSVRAYAAHFEAQLRRGTVRRLLHASYLWLRYAATVRHRDAR